MTSRPPAKLLVPKNTELEIHILKNFSDICLKKCMIPNQKEDDLSKPEKLCLGKCLDRAHDYLRIIEKVKLS